MRRQATLIERRVLRKYRLELPSCRYMMRMVRTSLSSTYRFFMGMACGILLAYQVFILYQPSITICTTMHGASELQQQLEDTKRSAKPRIRILCFVTTDPEFLDSRAIHVRDTWMKRCDVPIFFSSTENKTFPTIGLNGTHGETHVAGKSRAAWTYVYYHYFNDADYFVKADPDTYIVVENLREYLSHCDPSKPEMFGHGLNHAIFNKSYLSGGSGLVFSRESVRRLVTIGYALHGECMPDGGGEDYKTCRCLQIAGGKIVDTRDVHGKETFMPLTPPDHFMPNHTPDWYIWYRLPVFKVINGKECCSDYPATFHYVPGGYMYVLDYFLYSSRVVRDELRGITYNTRTRSSEVTLIFKGSLPATVTPTQLPTTTT